MVVASFHLSTFTTSSAARRLVRVPLDRRALHRVPGIRFGRLLGTGAGRRMAASADLRRWAVFAVWEDDDALESFTARHPIGRSFSEADEAFRVTLLPLGAEGRWGGVDPIDGENSVGRSGGPVAVLTRATVRWRNVPAFLNAVPAVDTVITSTEGLLETVGIGELPIGRQATFSLWRDVAAARAFAYSGDDHLDVIRRTRDEGWYGEEWFARFEPLRWSGTWSGRRPLG